jgi:glycosyltransferase involved in cell wall biosynthesis
VNDVVYMQAAGAPAVVGGAERQQWLLARALAGSGWAVSVGVRSGLNHGERRTFERVEFVGIGKDQVFRAWYRFLSTERPDWLYWRCADHLWGPAVAIAKLAGARTIFSAASDRDVRPRSADFRRRRWWPLYAWGLSQSDRIFVQHEGQRAGLAARWRSKSHIVPSLAGNAGVAPSHADRPGYVAWAGDLIPAKRPDVLVDIARRARDIRFLVCGDPKSPTAPPGYSEAIVRSLQAEPNMEYLGVVPQARAHQMIANACALLSTSESEGFPNTFLQAWSSGTPVVSLRVDPGGAIARLGLGAVSGETDGAVHDLHSLTASATLREEIGERARRHVARTHSDEAVTAAFNRAIDG